MATDLPIAPGRVIPAAAVRVKTTRASGPGGQHVNRTESKVQLTFDPAMVPWLDVQAKKRLYKLAGRRVDQEGRIRVVCQQSREQPENLERAREMLVAWVIRAMVRPKKRVATAPTRASKERRLADKKRRADTKLARGRVLEE